MKRLLTTAVIGIALTITSISPAFAANPAADKIPDVDSIPVPHDAAADGMAQDAAPPADASDGLGTAEGAGAP